MTSRENRGGPRVPDGVQRPASLPFGRGPNRSDLSTLPGTPGTPLPPSPAQPPGTVGYGEAGPLRQQLSSIPLEQQGPSVSLRDPSQAPDEPITSGINVGLGPGTDSLLDSPQQIGTKMSAAQMKYAYPLILRLATLPNATTEAKVLAQRIRANLPVQPEQMPIAQQGPPNGVPR